MKVRISNTYIPSPRELELFQRVMALEAQVDEMRLMMRAWEERLDTKTPAGPQGERDRPAFVSRPQRERVA